MSGPSQVCHLCREKQIGPTTDPWGTPDVTAIGVEVSPSRPTHCVRPSKNALIQFRVYDVTPCWCNL